MTSAASSRRPLLAAIITDMFQLPGEVTHCPHEPRAGMSNRVLAAFNTIWIWYGDDSIRIDDLTRLIMCWIAPWVM